MSTPPRTASASVEGQRFTVGAHTYAAIRSLGRYGVAERFLARSTVGDGELVLIQQLQDTRRTADRRRLLEEAWLLSHLRHPCIPRVLAVALRAPWPLVVMEYVEGMSLERLLNRSAVGGRPFSAPFAASVIAQLADALHTAHGLADDEGQPLHFVHRDVCPRNIHLTAHGEVLLTGFGAAFTTRPGRFVTRGMLVKGAGEYAAPEVLLHRKPDARADLYSLGLVLLEMLTHQHALDPAGDRTRPALPKHLAPLENKLRAEEPGWAPPVQLAARSAQLRLEDVDRMAAGAPAALRAVVQRALRPQLEDRYTSAAAMRDDLRAFLAQRPRPYGKPELAAELQRRIARQGYRRAGVEPSYLPVPAEFRHQGARAS
jgi:serine/threonine protein kinase